MGVTLLRVGIVAALLGGLGIAAAHGGTIHVDSGSSEPNPDGANWATAYRYLQDALAAAKPGDEILIAQGVYYPDQDSETPSGTGAREASFALRSGMSLIGGYSTGGGARDVDQYLTVLSGDLAQDDGADFANYSENSLHVVAVGGSRPIVLDGVSIVHGNADGSSFPHDHGGGVLCLAGDVTLRDCTLQGNSAGIGGGAYLGNAAGRGERCSVLDNRSTMGSGGGVAVAGASLRGTLTFESCVFVGNEASATAPALGYGGGLSVRVPSLDVVNCVFRGNVADYGGGLMTGHATGTKPRIINCTFTQNEAHQRGGGIYTSTSNDAPYVANSILYGNTINGLSNTVDAEAVLGGGELRHSCVQHYALAGLKGNLNDDPQFLGTDDLRLFNEPGAEAGSPCINAGLNSAIPTGVEYDIVGVQRKLSCGKPGLNTVDMGAYEQYLDCDGNGEADELACPVVAFIEAADPPSGTIDARGPFSPGTPSVEIGLGTQPITLDLGVPGIAAACFVLCEDLGATAGTNAIDSVVDNGDGTYTFTLTQGIALGSPQGGVGVPGSTMIRYLGTGDYALYHRLPCDVDQSGQADSFDIARINDCINGVVSCPLWIADIDVSGEVNAGDALELINLLNGAGELDEWGNVSLPPGGSQDCLGVCLPD
jgi:predicted outer membrane repeat protein